MPTFSQRRAPSIADRLAQIVAAPQVAETHPQQRFQMPAEKGPVFDAQIATRMQQLLGGEPDVAAVADPQQYDNTHLAKPDLFSASVAAVKALGKRKGDPWGKTGPGRFESDLTRAVHLQEREDRRY